MTATCSCGTPNCQELGWPHEWDPIAAGDDCTLCLHGLHPADTYSRYGSGYAHDTCINPPPLEVDQPLTWTGDQA